MKMVKQLVITALSLGVGLLASCNNVTPPVNPTGFAATVNSSTQITLNWQAVTGATNYSLERKTGTGTFSSVNASISTTTYQDTGLSAGTEYTYRLKATNSGGSSSGVETSGTTLPNPPANPTGFTATVNSFSQITLNWQAVSGATKYSLERKIGTGGFSLLGDNITATNYVDAGLSANTLYTYRLKAINAGGSSSGLEASGTTFGNPAQGTDVQLTNWPVGKTGTITFVAATTGPTSGPTLVTVNVDATGKFTYELPEPASNLLNPVSASGPGCNVISTPSDAKGISAGLSAKVAGETSAGEILIGNVPVRGPGPNVGDTSAILLFVDKGYTFSGNCSAASFSGIFRKGWNFATTIVTSTSPPIATDNSATTVLPGNVKWFYVGPGQSN